MPMMCGGTGDVKPVDGDVIQIVEGVRSSVEEKVGSSFSQFTAVTYKSQVVAGINYFVKVQVSDDEFIHVRIYKPLPGQGEPEVHSYQLKKAKDDLIEHF